MENTISRILEIEEKAKLIVDRANEYKVQLYEEFEQEIAQLEKEIADETTAKIKEYQAEVNKQLDEDVFILTQKSEKHLKELEELFDNHHAEIVNKIYEGIICS